MARQSSIYPTVGALANSLSWLADMRAPESVGRRKIASHLLEKARSRRKRAPPPPRSREVQSGCPLIEPSPIEQSPLRAMPGGAGTELASLASFL